MRYYKWSLMFIVEIDIIEIQLYATRILCLVDKGEGWYGEDIGDFTFFPIVRCFKSKDEIAYSDLPERYRKYIESEFFEIDVRKVKEKYLK